MNTDHLINIFREKFSAEPQTLFFAPGRINLIGEHTDYNGGHVLPCAINKGIYCAVRARSDKTLRMYSENFPQSGVVTADMNETGKTSCWADYPLAVARALSAFGYEPAAGADMAFFGDLPDGAGLSSSAALEVLTAKALCALNGLRLPGQLTAMIGQFAENRFIGVNCGIMDQFASAMGKRGHAVLLDTHALRFSYAPIPFDRVSIVAVNSGVKHSLASSEYNRRRAECEKALAQINARHRTRALCALTGAEFDELESYISDAVCRRRARHAVCENERTIEAHKALCAGDAEKLGRLMNESHESLKNDYEVSCEELDFLAHTAQKLPFVYGARMTGGGFGGCTVNIVRRGRTEEFSETIRRAYSERFGIDAEVYELEAGEGAAQIRDLCEYVSGKPSAPMNELL